ncbi:MAG: Asp23/Gls24 family envelope stress response protein [Oscillospiraceae bacterium]|nr:Asp23/Gls24 family envelope stress response protein [Oscillospiraceae bacterium]MBR5701156.1 Asp23/Gls24 family envelope stress response protein [Oscillospiraceae bacterium]
MADGKEYISKTGEDGSVNISEDVISIIAMEAMREVEGFGSISNPLSKDLAELIGKKSAARGVSVLPEEDSVTIDVFISVKYNYSVVQVSQAIQEAIRKSVEDMTGIPVKAVNVHVGSVAFEKGKQA